MSSKRQLQHIIKPTVNIPVAAYTATQTGATLDMQGWEAVTFYALITSWTSGTIAFAIYDSPDNITFTLVDPTATPDLIDSNGFVTVVDATTNGAIMASTYMGYKRYVRCLATGATTPSATFGVIAVQGFPRNSLP